MRSLLFGSDFQRAVLLLQYLSGDGVARFSKSLSRRLYPGPATAQPFLQQADCAETAEGTHWSRNWSRDDRAVCQPAFKVFGQIAGRAITRVRFALHTFCANHFQIAVERWHKRAQFRRRLFSGLLNNSYPVLPPVWPPAPHKIQTKSPSAN